MKTYNNPEEAFATYGRLLNQLGVAELPLACRGTLNKAAFESRKHLSTVEMPKAFTLRNNFENKQTLHYESAGSGLNIDQMKSSAGQSRTVHFRTGDRVTSDLFIQEKGGTIRARPGKSRLRTPTKAARVSNSYTKKVRNENQPTVGKDWPDLNEIETLAKIKDTTTLPLKQRIQRAHAIMARNRARLDDSLYIAPLLKRPGDLGVFRIKAGKPILIHWLEHKTRKPKKNPVVLRTINVIVPQLGEYFVEQADRRIMKAARKVFGL